ncbi:MAG: hypothetical protein ACXV8A_03850 [Chthoniobacterales bacterium]
MPAKAFRICTCTFWVSAGSPGRQVDSSRAADTTLGSTIALILPNENGLARLHRDYQELGLSAEPDPLLRISGPPPLGLNLRNTHLLCELKAAVRDFAPDLIIADPGNAIAKNSMERDYQEAFDRLREVLAESPEARDPPGLLRQSHHDSVV